MRDGLLTRVDAEKLLAPHLDGIREAIQRGWDDWHAMVAASPVTTPMRKTTRANAVYDFITDRAERYFDDAGVRTSRKGQYLAVAFETEQVVLRFKKYRGRSLRTSGIETMHRRDVEGQQATFAGLGVTFLNAGYLPDDAGLRLDRVAISCSYYNEVLWQIPLDSEVAAVSPLNFEETERPTVRSALPEAKDEGAEGP